MFSQADDDRSISPREEMSGFDGAGPAFSSSESDGFASLSGQRSRPLRRTHSEQRRVPDSRDLSSVRGTKLPPAATNSMSASCVGAPSFLTSVSDRNRSKAAVPGAQKTPLKRGVDGVVSIWPHTVESSVSPQQMGAQGARGRSSSSASS
jgi:hypothetical protein